MTIREAIDRADGLKPNHYSEEDKVRWLSDLDNNIFWDVILTHAHRRDLPHFVPYSTEDMDKDLLVKEPYCELYTKYIEMKIDEANGETARYNNSAILFNSYMDNFSKFWNKTHMPLGPQSFQIF